MFSDKQLKDMILPLLAEQFLLMLVGLADTFVVSYAGEAAVSGVSLVNSFNTIFLYLFTALSSGGAVIVSQYIGRKREDDASEAVSQLLMVSTLFSLLMAGLVLAGGQKMLGLMFGKVEPDVMEACVTYLRISAYSYPALAIYNTGAALYRSIGKTSTTMYISVLSNAVNVVGNVIGVFILKAGVAGVAYPSLAARGFSAAVITVMCFSGGNGIRYKRKDIFKWNGKMLKSILGIAVPNGIESGVFQFVKVALSSVVALFGTCQIAANGIAQSIWSIAALVSSSMGPVFITVIGQCMGASETEQAEYYFKKLTRISVLGSLAWNAVIFAITPYFMRFYAVSRETKRLVILLVLVHNIFNALAFPFADPLGKGLRSAGDIRFTTAVSLATTIGGRLAFSLFLGIVLDMGVMGVAYAMCLDWVLRAVIYWIRFKKGKWKTFQMI